MLQFSEESTLQSFPRELQISLVEDEFTQYKNTVLLLTSSVLFRKQILLLRYFVDTLYSREFLWSGQQYNPSSAICL
jgi:hypothetical protein